MLSLRILALSLVALTSVTGDTQPLQFGDSWSSHPNHVILPGGSRGQKSFPPSPSDNQVGSPSDLADPSSQSPSLPSNCLPQPGQTQTEQPTKPGASQIAWCTPLQGNASEPVVAWFTHVQPGDTAPVPTNATTPANGTETDEAATKKTPAKPELGSCIPINPDGNEAGSPQTPGQIGWFTPIPKPDEVTEPEMSPEELSEPGGNVTLGWCTPLLDNADTALAQLGECRPYQQPNPEDAAASSTTTTTTAKPETKKDGEPTKELLGWYTPLKIDPAAKGSVVAYFIPVVASVPPPKEPVTKETKAAESGGGETPSSTAAPA